MAGSPRMVGPSLSKNTTNYQNNAATPQELQDISEAQLQQQQEQQPQPPESNNVSLVTYLNSCFQSRAKSPQVQGPKKQEEIRNSSTELRLSLAPSSSSSASTLEIFKNYGDIFKQLEQKHSTRNDGNFPKRLSTEEIMKVAGARYIHLFDQKHLDFSMHMLHPFGYALSGLSEEETRDVELAHLLLTAAENLGHQQFDTASRLLSRCEWIAFERANPVQRVIYYFAEALREKIDNATGKFGMMRSSEEPSQGLSTNPACLTHFQKIPYTQAMQLTAIQTIFEHVGSIKKLHLIDLEIRSGIQWIAFIQTLAVREMHMIKHVKITAIGWSGSMQEVEETGKRLESFAESLNVPFKFKSLCLSCWLELREMQFQTADDEAVVVYADKVLRTSLSYSPCLDHILSVLKNLAPLLMVVTEVEANHNSPVFVNRFVEALFLYSAHFDCIDTCMGDNEEHRTEIETIISRGIREIVAMEGGERVARSVNIDTWRAFFSRFRMVEIGFSETSYNQPGFVLKQSPFARFFTLHRDGNSILTGWKGTPLFSLSVWKFSKIIMGKMLIT